MHYVYVIHTQKAGLYIGYTIDLRQRLREHKRKKGNCKLIYFEAYSSRNLARRRERRLKHYGSAWQALKQRLELV